MILCKRIHNQHICVDLTFTLTNVQFCCSERVLELPVFELSPSSQQVVFQGDKLPFQCHASATDPQTDIYWVRNQEKVLSNKSLGIIVHKQDEGHNTGVY